MVSNRRLEYGFNGYQAPATARAPQSARRGCPISKKVDDHKMGAFDLLATVAGELLLEKDVHPSSSCSLTLKDKSSVNEVIHDKEWHDKCKASELDLSTQEKCGKSCVVSKIFSVDKDQDNGSEFKSKDDSVSSAIEVGLSTGDRSNCNQEDEGMLQCKDALLNHGNSACRSDTDLCSLGGPVKCTSDNRKVVSGDDDDNLSGCIHLSTMMKKKKPFNSVPRICGRRIRKILASKYWNAPKSKAGHFNRSGGHLRIAYSDRIGCYRRQRSQRTYPFKKRFFDLNCVKNFDEKDRNLAPKEDINMDVSEDGLSSSKASQRSSHGRRNSHVKFRIKSFRVPELFIEVAETATIGSLKRMVMEALSAILGGGVRIGVLLRGKKVRDDSETLLQSGISHDNQPDALGFTLEPNYSVTPFENPGPSHLSLPSDSPHPYAGRAEDSVACHGDFLPVTEPQGTNSGKLTEDDCHDSHAPVEMPIDDCLVYSRALAVVPTMNNGEALPEIPVQQQLGNSEVSQRRARRPFSVAEVEALVQAVEKLGTGRWRDVKVRAFDDAKHRTYVDLKDKWKTLVRTARISPQQRRGEPVPQELLDRVLAAHAYWSHRQSKPQQHQVSNA